MSEMTLFGSGNPLVNSDLFKSLRDMNKTLAGGGSGAGKRISIKGNKFRLFVDGEQVSVSKDDHLNIVVVNVALVAVNAFTRVVLAKIGVVILCFSIIC